MSLPLETSLTPTAAAIAPQIWNLAAVILGGAIATTTSYLMQRKANKDIIKRDNTMRHETQKVGALRAMFRLLKISNGLHSTNNRSIKCLQIMMLRPSLSRSQG